MTHTMDKQNTQTTIKAAVRNEVIDFIIEALKGQYGEDAVFWTRTEGASPKNELIVEASEVDVDGNVVPIFASVSVSAKAFAESVGPKKTTPAWDSVAAKQRYEDYIVEKAEKEADKAKKKASKESADESF